MIVVLNRLLIQNRNNKIHKLLAKVDGQKKNMKTLFMQFEFMEKIGQN